MTFSHILDAQITDYIVITIIIIYGLDTLDFSSINNNDMKKKKQLRNSLSHNYYISLKRRNNNNNKNSIIFTNGEMASNLLIFA